MIEFIRGKSGIIKGHKACEKEHTKYSKDFELEIRKILYRIQDHGCKTQKGSVKTISNSEISEFLVKNL